MVMCISAKRSMKVATLPIGNLYRYYIMGEKLFLDFGAKFQRLFYLSPFNYTYLSEFCNFWTFSSSSVENDQKGLYIL